MKIDGSIVREIAESNLSQTLVRAIQEIASNMGVRTIAESIDSPQIFIALRDHGVAYGQGHWFDVPRPFESWLAESALCRQVFPAPGVTQIVSFRGRVGLGLKGY